MTPDLAAIEAVWQQTRRSVVEYRGPDEPTTTPPRRTCVCGRRTRNPEAICIYCAKSEGDS